MAVGRASLQRGFCARRVSACLHDMQLFTFLNYLLLRPLLVCRLPLACHVKSTFRPPTDRAEENEMRLNETSGPSAAI